jgi:hypothetical protein
MGFVQHVDLAVQSLLHGGRSMWKLSSIQYARLVDTMRSIAVTGNSDKRQATRMEIQARIWIATRHRRDPLPPSRPAHVQHDRAG